MKQCKHNLNEMSHLTVTPGKSPGVQTSFKELLREQILDLRSEGQSGMTATEPIKVRISGDGVRVTRNTNYIIMSFSILQEEEELMSSRGNRTIAIVQGSEDFTTITKSFNEVFQEINDAQEEGFIKVEDMNVPVELYLGGDYKFLLLFTGLYSGAT